MTRRPIRLLAASVLAFATIGAGLPAASAATDTTRIRPTRLDRGENPAVPSVLGTTILDGDVHVRVRHAEELELLGASHGDYVATVYGPRRASVQRIAPDGSRTVVARRGAGEMTLSGDGEHLIRTKYRNDDHTVLVVKDADTGETLTRRSFRGFISVLDADESRTVLGGTSPSRTLWWNHASNTTKRISRRAGYFADITAGRVAVHTGDVYEGGCSVFAKLSGKNRRLWRSCDDGVVAVSPNGRKVATLPLLSDGPIGTLEVHRQHGRLLDRYRTGQRARFGPVTFERNRALLMTVVGPRRTTIVRCSGAECERASRSART